MQNRRKTLRPGSGEVYAKEVGGLLCYLLKREQEVLEKVVAVAGPEVIKQ